VSRILLADESPHAQRMGESILRDEGFEVVTVTDGETAIRRLADVDPDLVLADAALPKRNGYELCQYIKTHPRHSLTRVILTAGAAATFDDERARRVGSDASLRKPFEASAVLDTVRPLIELAVAERATRAPEADTAIDRDRIRAAVTLALDAAMPAIITELTERVTAALKE
jgi:CheY-like chemotaxis protein